jgi:hypothetical protein
MWILIVDWHRYSSMNCLKKNCINWRNDEINHIFHLHFAAVKYTYMITNICFEILNYRAVQNCFLSLRAVAICATYLNNSKQRNYRAVTICCNPLRCDMPPQDGARDRSPILDLRSRKRIRWRGLVSASASWSAEDTWATRRTPFCTWSLMKW